MFKHSESTWNFDAHLQRSLKPIRCELYLHCTVVLSTWQWSQWSDWSHLCGRHTTTSFIFALQQDGINVVEKATRSPGGSQAQAEVRSHRCRCDNKASQLGQSHDQAWHVMTHCHGAPMSTRYTPPFVSAPRKVNGVFCWRSDCSFIKLSM